MKKILMLTTKYPCGVGEGWLTNELAECFVNEGYTVSVLALSWEYSDGESDELELNGVKIYRRRLSKILYKKNIIFSMLKIFSFSLLVRLQYHRALKEADIIIATTPCIVVWGLLSFFWRQPKAKKYLILWDFFPYYMRDLWAGSKKNLFNFFLRCENNLYNKFDVIGCMTRGSVDFLKSNYRVDPGKITLLPLWTKQLPRLALSYEEKLTIRNKYGIGKSSFVSVYGGAMSVVQGLDNIINLAQDVKVKEQFQFLFIGKGSELPRLRQRAVDEKLTNILFIDQVPRDEYEKIIAACDLGLVSLSGRHAVPSFPSKSIDYLKVGIPILASIDRFTEFGKILMDDMQAGLWVEAGDRSCLANTLERLSTDAVFLSNCSLNGRSYYERELAVELATKNIICSCETL